MESSEFEWDREVFPVYDKDQKLDAMFSRRGCNVWGPVLADAGLEYGRAYAVRYLLVRHPNAHGWSLLRDYDPREDGEKIMANRMTDLEAAEWLLDNGYEVPVDVQSLVLHRLYAPIPSARLQALRTLRLLRESPPAFFRFAEFRQGHPDATVDTETAQSLRRLLFFLGRKQAADLPKRALQEKAWKSLKALLDCVLSPELRADQVQALREAAEANVAAAVDHCTGRFGEFEGPFDEEGSELLRDAERAVERLSESVQFAKQIEAYRPTSDDGDFGSFEGPEWDAERRELRYGGRVVRRFLRPAKNAELLLTTFQECGWSPRIDSPFPPSDSSKLSEAVRTLNNGLQAIHFLRDGTSMGAMWRRTDAKE